MKKLALIFVGLWISLNAASANISVDPIRVYMSPIQRMAVVTVANVSQFKQTVQVTAYDWNSNEPGADLPRSTTVFANPRLFSLEPGKTQLIRIGYRGKRKPTEEFFRVVIHQLAVKNPNGARLQFSVKHNVPIFLRAPTERYSWTVDNVGTSQGYVGISLNNTGSRHVKAHEITVTGLRGGQPAWTRTYNGWYVLPGTSAEFFDKSPLAAGDCDVDSVNIKVQPDPYEPDVDEKVTLPREFNMSFPGCG